MVKWLNKRAKKQDKHAKGDCAGGFLKPGGKDSGMLTSTTPEPEFALNVQMSGRRKGFYHISRYEIDFHDKEFDVPQLERRGQ
ncbi:MAG: hypothetical protein KBG62_07620 [Propionivibrio sp.]|nr:hypothetical protein [Propionivibrio sp.]